MHVRFGANFVIFLLFFGIAALDAIQAENWLRAAFWFAIGSVFFLGDNLPAFGKPIK